MASDISDVKRLTKNEAKTHSTDEAFIVACYNGRVEVIDSLIVHTTPDINKRA